MRFLLDANLVSEPTKPQPNASVMRWFDSVDPDATFLSVITHAELRRGIERLQEGARKRLLRHWLELELAEQFFSRTLPIDLAIADAWGVLTARRAALGRPIAPMDAFLAATALVHDLALVTRNVADFAFTVPTLVNPWS